MPWTTAESKRGAREGSGQGANQVLSDRLPGDMGRTPMPRGTGVPPVGLSVHAKADLRGQATGARQVCEGGMTNHATGGLRISRPTIRPGIGG